jgi:hypothetical protein
MKMKKMKNQTKNASNVKKAYSMKCYYVKIVLAQNGFVQIADLKVLNLEQVLFVVKNVETKT